MTDLAFHFGAPDKLAYACRLVRKALGSGAKVVLVADTGSVGQLDSNLWALSATEFLPHCLGTADAAVKGRTPLLLVTRVDQALTHSEVLVNVTDTVPQGFDRFERLIEIVGTQELDRSAARERWRYYTQRGYTITRHDLSLKRVD